MSIAKSMTPFEIEPSQRPPMEPDLPDMADMGDSPVSTPTEDGGMVVDFPGGDQMDQDPTGEEPFDATGSEHNENLAEVLDDSDLSSMASELVSDFEADRLSRKDWEVAYIKGLDLLGMKIEDRTTPWAGASGVFHPVLTEAVVRFQAQAMGELYPASGPVRTKVLGKVTTEKYETASRVENELNYIITESMPEYRDELEQMLFHVPLAGSAFKKVYYDPLTETPSATFVPAQDFVIAYGASNLRTCPRYTHIMKKEENEILKLQLAGFYRDVDLPTAGSDISDITEKYDELEGSSPSISDDSRHTVLEMHVDLNMPEPYDDPDGIARPYVITIEKSSRTILAIRRNWYEDDAKKKKRMHFVHYPYLPGLGFYGTGLIHLIGGLTKSATSILRQLIDAGTLANLPAGLKSRGLRIKGDNTPLKPGEFRDVDVPSGAIKDAITFLPYKEPSSVLYQLLSNVVEEARRIGSVADVQLSEMNANAPVGTTLALMERSLKVMSGVQARLHAAMKAELRLLAAIVHDFMPPTYEHGVEGDFDRQADFSGKVDVIPVSDPNAATMTQRIMQYQAALQLAQQAPQLYDMGKLHRQMLEVMGIQDAGDIIKLPDDIKQKDPVSENMGILKQEPVKAFLYQDHDAHIQVHTAMSQDPKIEQMIGQSPFAAAIKSAMQAHITEHVAMKYRVDIEKNLGVSLPGMDEQLPEDAEIQLSRISALAADKLLKKDQAEAAAAAAAQAAADPLTQIQQKELQIKETDVANKLKIATSKIMADAMSEQQRIALERERIASNEQIAGAKLGLEAAQTIERSSAQDAAEGVRIGLDVAQTLAGHELERDKAAMQLAGTLAQTQATKQRNSGGK